MNFIETKKKNEPGSLIIFPSIEKKKKKTQHNQSIENSRLCISNVFLRTIQGDRITYVLWLITHRIIDHLCSIFTLRRYGAKNIHQFVPVVFPSKYAYVIRSTRHQFQQQIRIIKKKPLLFDPTQLYFTYKEIYIYSKPTPLLSSTGYQKDENNVPRYICNDTISRERKTTFTWS